MAVETIALNVRIYHAPKAYEVQMRHPVYLDWHTVATFDMSGVLPYYHAHAYAREVAAD